jgi:hypothetical protein
MSRNRRPNSNLGQRLVRGIIGLVLITWGLGALGIELPFGLVMFFIGIAILASLMRSSSMDFGDLRDQFEDWAEDIRDFDFSLQSVDEDNRRGGSSQHSRRRQYTPPQDRRPQPSQRRPTANRIHKTALKAARKAGRDPREMRVVPVDVGILAYENQGETPALFRESRLPDEAEYIRPFIVMRSPRHARGTIRFELVDGDGDLMFVDETPWELKEGDTFIYPSTWLPMRRVADIGGEWQLRISAAGTMLAVHEFMWRNEGGGAFRAYLNGDGEISEDLVEELSGTNVGRLSLDELLDDQEGGLMEIDPEVEAASRKNQMINRQYNRRQ